MRTKVIFLILAVIIVGVFGGIGTYAWFTSQATSADNAFQAGTLRIDGANTTEPSPLFKTDYGEGDYSNYNVGLWYPGKQIAPARNYTIENIGTLPVRVAGISARITSFQKDSTVYSVDDMDNWSADIKDAYNEFTEHLMINVSRSIDGEYFSGNLKSLINGPKPLKRPSDDYVITLNATKRANLLFGAEMSTLADNRIQGVTANVDITIHATQDDADAVTSLLPQ